MLLIPLIALTYVTKAQTKLIIKQDTTHIKTTAGAEKFRKNDSVYTALAKKWIDSLSNIDISDLRLTECDFEKEANAEILLDNAHLVFSGYGVVMERHKRIKIFNEHGKDAANIRIEYNNKFGKEAILAVEAETINLVNGKIERTKLDSSFIYRVHTDKQKDAIVFTMPNVKPGSLIEYGYVWQRAASRNLPDWDFQNDLPTRLSTYSVMLNRQFQFTLLTEISKPFTKDETIFKGYGHLWSMTDIPSAKEEPFMRSKDDGLDRVSIILKSFIDFSTFKTKELSDSWETIGKQIANDKEFYKPYDQNLGDIDTVLAKAKTLKSEDEKIQYLFNTVKNRMKWNEDKIWYSKDGIKDAWKKQSGNWGEINMALCKLLNKGGIKAYPMLTSTRDNGLIYSNFANIFQVNTLVAYVPVPGDTSKYYVLDATSKYNQYNIIPFELLNSTGIWMDKDDDKYGTVYLHIDKPARQMIFVDAEIKPDGSMAGSAVISNCGYTKAIYREIHATLDEKKYNEYITDNDNNIKISDIKFEDAEVDTLPLTQTITFKSDLSGNDDKYIYLNPNIFTSLHNNPFISLKRQTNIDLGSKQIVTINGRYKMPEGYKIESLPQNEVVRMADGSITFRRVAGEEDGYISINYVINYKRSVYSSTEYPGFYAYFKKMFELLNEPVVLKKS